MKTETYHISNLGKFQSYVSNHTNIHGYVRVFCCNLSRFSDDELFAKIVKTNNRTWKATYLTEIAERKISAWQNS